MFYKYKKNIQESDMEPYISVRTLHPAPVFRIRIRIRIRISFKFVSWIRIRIPNVDPDPDPAADKISSKSQNNSYHLELFD